MTELLRNVYASLLLYGTVEAVAVMLVSAAIVWIVWRVIEDKPIIPW